MIVQWTETARRRIQQIKSDRYTQQETIDYKIKLIRRVETTVVNMGTTMPSREYRNTYYCIVDRYVVSYKVMDKGERYVITSFKHGAMKRNLKY
ncbi:type II toxin-antitoxin system RelE/ParE family toxin [Paenibacillus alkaliterrae]|uniref:type II toxin-antitoxin system RelE/ParE family toxin n=1 Tax=Paenibacillus alkaliterrae TaxID=320909 RepID=UPI001F404958|nr:type II toxin-antitoxin system RelE/ParE family toxin [Paenibacillus alkaliterrae]MCF2939589.1 type II toxin-antitoxin system RelE/ParE family toxin [Paenibacillus alkaliterrae]